MTDIGLYKTGLTSEINADRYKSARYMIADWPAPINVKALVTSRKGGFSRGQFSSFNLATHVNDELGNVAKNRQRLQQDLNLNNEPFWLEQIHSNLCVPWQDLNGPNNNNKLIKADASYSCCAQQVCVVLTADCLPILLTNQKGDWVAACHAGWRGLKDGVVQNTANRYPGQKTDLIAWIGPAITQQHFEVGDEVRELFIKLDSAYQQFFKPNQNARYQFDFISLAKLILENMGISVYGGNRCSFTETETYYSFRRDNETGRMASLIWFE